MRDYPLNQIYFYLTEGCNLACRHCWLAPPLDREGNKYPALPVRLFEAAVSDLGSLRKGIPGMFTGVCGRCIMKRMCLGACIAQNYYRSGSIGTPFWFCEIAETEGLFPSTRLAS